MENKTFIPKRERETPVSKPPSMRRALRAHKRGFTDHRTKKGQHIPDTLVFKFSKKLGNRKKGDKITVPLSRYGWMRDLARKLRRLEADGYGKIKVQNKRTVWHDLAVTI